MNPLKTTRTHSLFTYHAGLALLLGGAAYGQVTSINSVNIQERVYDDVPGATLTVVTNYPSVVSFNEQNVSAASGFANRDIWRFSADNGATPYQFQHNDYFHVSMDFVLTGTPITPRKEAGILFSTASEGDIQFILDTDGHEVVQFGGLSFYTFSGNNLVSYNSGDTIRLGMSYFLDGNGKNALQFFANQFSSPVFEFTASAGNGSLDAGDGSLLGAYFQIVQDSSNPSNSGSLSNLNISISPQPQLNIVSSGNQEVIYWPASATNYVLQSSTNVASTTWTTVSNATKIIGVTVTNTSPQTFYRLQGTP
ncbi:MAG TPA: hypothetical protein VHB20_04750 [Verrucomicrobiae bacterium]|jgi:hypothetical protein|nr:hypothetical protein [Verrucomicrobiae bacterium]